MEKKNSLVGFILTFLLGATVVAFIFYMGYFYLMMPSEEDIQESNTEFSVVEENE